MIGQAGHFTGLRPDVFTPAVDVVKAVEPYVGNGPIFGLSDAEAKMREASVQKTKTVCTYCGVGCAFDVWTRERRILKVEPTGRGASQRHLDVRQGEVRVGLRQRDRPPPHPAPAYGRRAGVARRSARRPGTRPSTWWRPGCARSPTSTGRTASPLSRRRRRRTRRATSSRSWPAPCSGRTTSTTARATARRRPPSACGGRSATAATPARSTTSEPPTSSSSSGPTRTSRTPSWQRTSGRPRKSAGRRTSSPTSASTSRLGAPTSFSTPPRGRI